MKRLVVMLGLVEAFLLNDASPCMSQTSIRVGITDVYLYEDSATLSGGVLVSGVIATFPPIIFPVFLVYAITARKPATLFVQSDTWSITTKCAKVATRRYFEKFSVKDIDSIMLKERPKKKILTLYMNQAFSQSAYKSKNKPIKTLSYRLIVDASDSMVVKNIVQQVRPHLNR